MPATTEPTVRGVPQEIVDSIFDRFHSDALNGLRLKAAHNTGVTIESLCAVNLGLLFVNKMHSKRFQAEIYKRAQICLPITMLRYASSATGHHPDDHPRILMRVLMGALPNIRSLEFVLSDISLARSRGFTDLDEQSAARRVKTIVEEELLTHMDPTSGCEDLTSFVEPVLSCYQAASIIDEALQDSLKQRRPSDPEPRCPFRLRLQVHRCFIGPTTGYSRPLLGNIHDTVEPFLAFNRATRHEVTSWMATGDFNGGVLQVSGTMADLTGRWFPRPYWDQPWAEGQAMGLIPLAIIYQHVFQRSVLSNEEYLSLMDYAPHVWLDDSTSYPAQRGYYRALHSVRGNFVPPAPTKETGPHRLLDKYEAYRFFRIFLGYDNRPPHREDWATSCNFVESFTHEGQGRLYPKVYRQHFDAQKQFFVHLFNKQGTAEAHIPPPEESDDDDE